MAKRPKPLAAEEFNELREAYVKGSMTLKELHADRLKGRVHFKTFQQRVSRAKPKWSQLRAEWLQKQEDARHSASAGALELSATTQTETRTKYAIRARRMADLVMGLADRLNDGRKLSPMDVQRLTGGLRQAQQIEFAALGISADHITLQEEDAEGTLLTLDELMKREREKKGLEPYEFGIG